MEDDKEKTVIDPIRLIEDLSEQLRQCSRLVGDAEMRRVLEEAEAFLTSSPHPEAREEERVISHFHAVRDALESFDDPDCTRFIRIAKRDQALVSIDQLCLDYRNYRLAAPQPQAETQNLIKHLQANLEAANKTSQEYEAWGKNLYIVIDDLRAAIDEWGCKHDHPEIMHEIDAANTPAAPAPRPADELDLLDALQGTAEEHGKQFWERRKPARSALREPDGRKGE